MTCTVVLSVQLDCRHTTDTVIPTADTLLTP
jgi:hypothetical protein